MKLQFWSWHFWREQLILLVWFAVKSLLLATYIFKRASSWLLILILLKNICSFGVGFQTNSPVSKLVWKKALARDVITKSKSVSIYWSLWILRLVEGIPINLDLCSAALSPKVLDLIHLISIKGLIPPWRRKLPFLANLHSAEYFLAFFWLIIATSISWEPAWGFGSSLLSMVR